MAGIKKLGDFEVSVSLITERHPESPDADADIDVLARKVGRRSEPGITQFFSINDVYFRYLDKVRARGI